MGSPSIRCANPVHYEERGNQERVEVTCALGKTASHFIGVFQEIKDLEATLKSDSTDIELLRTIARRFDAALATGKYDALFGK